MISNRNKKLKLICSLVILFAIAVMPLVGIGDSAVQAGEVHRRAPINPDSLDFWERPRPEPFYGYIPPPMDLSHLKGIPVERTRALPQSLPNTFDWRTRGKVTPVRNQLPCGTCWAHCTLAAVESKVLIEDNVSYDPAQHDFSEQSLICCTDPSWVYLLNPPGYRCNGGGNSFMVTDTLAKKGTRLEECQPYNTDAINTEACDDTCVSIKRITGYRLIANSADQIDEVKNAIYNHGPVGMSYCDVDSHHYPGNIYYWPDYTVCPEGCGHCVCIVGWDDNVPWPDHTGSGAWIVKNSWGTEWPDGDNGYFYFCYGSAGMHEVASFDYKDYNPDEEIYYWDEAGWVGAVGWEGHDSAWMASIFTSTQDGTLSNVGFWTTSSNAEYKIYVYLDGNISDGLQNLATSQLGTCHELGYYSIPLDNPVSLTNGEAFIIAVKMTTPGFNYPIPIEYVISNKCEPPIQKGACFERLADGDSWTDAGVEWEENVCLRAVVKSEGALAAPTVTTNATTLVEETTATLNGAVSDDGGEACNYRFEYDTNSGEPYAHNTGWTGSKTSGQSFSESISGLNKGTKYYFRAQAKNSAGTSSGFELTFLTKPDVPTSFDASTASTTQIDLSWTKGDGAQKTKIQRKQGSYPANRNDGTQVYFDTGTGVPDTGLSAGTTYYYRAWSYVQGSEQWSDSPAQASATTMPVGAPSVTTNAATDITAATTTLNGNLTSLGSASSVSVSFEWGLTSTYGNETSPPTVMTATEPFSFNLGSLNPDTTYHFRAKAVGDGTSYGADKSFTTPAVPMPKTIYVDDDFADDPANHEWDTIQEGIDDASDGDTIIVHPGTYHGFTVEDRNDISIIGEEGTIVNNANRFVDGYEWWVMALVMNSTNINIEGIIFDGEEIEVSMIEGIACGDSTGSIDHVTVRNMIGTEMAMGVCIWGTEEGTTALDISHLTVENCILDVWVENAETNFDRCSIAGMAPNGGHGIMAMDNAQVTMENCEIYDCWKEAPEPGQAGFGMVIGMREEYEADYGIEDERPSTVQMTGCTISHNGFAIYVDDDGDLIANYNNIQGNDFGGIYKLNPPSVDATENWWGHASGPYNETTNPDGQGDAVTDNVDYAPWLKAEITPVATGLDSIKENLVIAYGYKAGEGVGGWTCYCPSWPAEMNTLEILYVGRGYWINVTGVCNLEYDAQTYSLDAGWNLIGWLGW